MNNPECFKHCPRIFDCAERASSLGRTGVLVSVPEAKKPVEELITECAIAAESDCEGPERQEVPEPRQSLLGRLGLLNTPGSGIKYICGRTGQGPQEDRYLFKDA